MDDHDKDKDGRLSMDEYLGNKQWHLEQSIFFSRSGIGDAREFFAGGLGTTD